MISNLILKISKKIFILWALIKMGKAYLFQAVINHFKQFFSSEISFHWFAIQYFASFKIFITLY
jgi:hypothetical protein